MVLDAGYEIIGEFLSRDQLICINSEVDSVGLPARSGGIRNAEKKFSSINDLANSEKLYTSAESYLPGAPSIVRAILFNKTTDNNWLVAWHQDRTVAVSDKYELAQWGPWSVKEGVHHVQPPVEVLDKMVTFRIHLDDAYLENGCLKVLPGSQQLGILEPAAIRDYVQHHRPVICEAPAGSVLVMRPHILHSSSKASKPSRRRILHLEYSSYQLPSGITWV